MKYAWVCVLMLLCFSCKKEKSGYKDQLKSSRQALDAFKVSSKNSYRYVAFATVTIGINPTYNQTTITVTNGQVTAREYAIYSITALNTSTPIPPQYSYSETKTDLGIHSTGGALLTLDEIYDKAETEWLTADPSQNTIVYETNNNGLISSCGYYQIGNAYVPFIGINIKSITAL